jgi:hypothetical protein
MLLLGALMVGVTPTPPSSAEDKAPEKPEKLPTDLAFVYESGGSFVTVRPADLLDASPLKNLPPRAKRELERMSSDAQRFIGLSIADVERITVVMPSAPEPVVIVRTIKAYDSDAVLKIVGPDARAEKYKGYSLQGQREQQGMSVCTIDDKTYAVGRGRGLKAAIDQIDGRSTPRPHGLALEWAAAKHQIVIGAAPETIFMMLWLTSFHEASAEPKATSETRPIPLEPRPKSEPSDKKGPPRPATKPADPTEKKQDIRAEHFVVMEPDRFEPRRAEPDLAEMLDRMPVEALPYKPILTAKSFAAAIDLGEESKAQWRVAFANEDAAIDGEVAIRVALYVCREALGRLPHEIRVSAEAAPAMRTSVDAIRTSLRSAPVQRRGAVVEGSLAVKTDTATLKPLFAEMEATAHRAEVQNNLKQIGIAMHAYHDAMGALPGPAIVDKTGKPLLSWRVAILPYIEQQNLYRQFKLDEPWDSEHNIKLLDKMPAIYALPTRNAKKGETFFRVFTGPNTPYHPERPGGAGPRIVEFTDGTSNTILVAEANGSVPWSKPEDLVIDPKKPLPKLGGAYPDTFLALFADGSVHMMPTKIDEQKLRWLIDPADGMPVDVDALEPGRNRPRQIPDTPRGEGNPVRPPSNPPAPPPERKP